MASGREERPGPKGEPATTDHTNGHGWGRFKKETKERIG
jgi:hypothetical protein